MSDKKLKIKIIIGSTRKARFSEKPAHYLFGELQKHEGVEAELLDLRDFPMPFFEAPVSPMRANGKYDHDVIQKWAEKIKEADAFIIVTAEYNHGYPAVLKNAMDVIYPEWNHKAVAFVGYGINGGANAIAQLVQVAIELKMVPISKSLHIPPDIHMKFLMEGAMDLQLFDQLRKGHRGDIIAMFFSELIKMTSALKKEYHNIPV